MYFSISNYECLEGEYHLIFALYFFVYKYHLKLATLLFRYVLSIFMKLDFEIGQDTHRISVGVYGNMPIGLLQKWDTPILLVPYREYGKSIRFGNP